MVPSICTQIPTRHLFPPRLALLSQPTRTKLEGRSSKFRLCWGTAASTKLKQHHFCHSSVSALRRRRSLLRPLISQVQGGLRHEHCIRCQTSRAGRPHRGIGTPDRRTLAGSTRAVLYPNLAPKQVATYLLPLAELGLTEPPSLRSLQERVQAIRTEARAASAPRIPLVQQVRSCDAE